MYLKGQYLFLCYILMYSKHMDQSILYHYIWFNLSIYSSKIFFKNLKKNVIIQCYSNNIST